MTDLEKEQLRLLQQLEQQGISPGAYVLIVSHQYPEEHVLSYSPHWKRPPSATYYDGRPIKVLAISFPFVACEHGDLVFSVDLRETVLMKADPTYVKVLKPYAPRMYNINGTMVPMSFKEKTKKRKRDDKTCPRCGGRIRQRMRTTKGGWRYICNECDYDGGVVEG